MYDDDSLYCLEPRLRSRRVFSPRRQVASRIKSPRYAVVLEETKEDPSLACPPARRRRILIRVAVDDRLPREAARRAPGALRLRARTRRGARVRRGALRAQERRRRLVGLL